MSGRRQTTGGSKEKKASAEELKKEEVERHKQIRKGRKTSVTRWISTLNRMFSEEHMLKKKDEVIAASDKLTQSFQEFTASHGEYLRVAGDILFPTTQEEYYIEVETRYTECKKEYNTWLAIVENRIPRTVNGEVPTGMNAALSTNMAQVGSVPIQSTNDQTNDGLKTLISAVTLPKLELMEYSGDPLQYHAFMNAFQETVDDVDSTPSAKLNRLLAYTSGDAHKAIKPMLVVGGSEGYSRALEILRSRYGDDLIISQAVMKKLRSGGMIKGAAQLHKLADELTASNLVLTKLKKLSEVESQNFIACVVDRLQSYLKTKWSRLAMDIKNDKHVYPKFEDLVKFIEKEANIASDPVYGEQGLLHYGNRGSDGKAGAGKAKSFASHKVGDSNGTGNGHGNGHCSDATDGIQHCHYGMNGDGGNTRGSGSGDRGTNDYGTGDRGSGSGARGSSGRGTGDGTYKNNNNNNNGASSRKYKFPCNFCKDSSHPIYLCHDFRALKADQRLEFVRNARLCVNCYFNNHSVENCRFDSKCGVSGCKSKHSRLLHLALSGKESSVHSKLNQTKARTFASFHSKVCVPIVKVKVNNKIDCTAMLDTCSTATFISRALAEELGVHSQRINYSLSTLTDAVTQETGLISTLVVESSEGQSLYLKNVHIISHIPGSTASIDCARYSHLSDLDVITSSASVGLLIGQDNSECLLPLEVRKGDKGEPFAVKTVLGWSIHGSEDHEEDFCGLLLTGLVNHSVLSNYVSSSIKGLCSEAVEASPVKGGDYEYDHTGFSSTDLVSSRALYGETGLVVGGTGCDFCGVESGVCRCISSVSNTSYTVCQVGKQQNLLLESVVPREEADLVTTISNLASQGLAKDYVSTSDYQAQLVVPGEEANYFITNSISEDQYKETDRTISKDQTEGSDQSISVTTTTIPTTTISDGSEEKPINTTTIISDGSEEKPINTITTITTSEDLRKGSEDSSISISTDFRSSRKVLSQVAQSLESRPSDEIISGESVQQGQTLEQMVQRLWEIDCEGLASEDTAYSELDRQVIELWNRSIQFKDGHYELPIPWKRGVSIPNNYGVAKHRLSSTTTSVTRKGILTRYNEEMDKLFEKGFAEQVDLARKSDKVWYLPHHAVVTDKKPDKVRVVFDCAAKYGGESLNDKCLQGPDLNNKLTHVLLRFRQHPVAIMADVEAMFYQVRVTEKDRDALRFLWHDEEGNEVTFRMKVHIFGGVWCPSIATYAMRRTVEDQQVSDEFISKVINKSFYVDDMLQSVSSLDEVEKVTSDVRTVLKEGGFNLTKFISNNQQVLSGIPEEDKAKEIRSKRLGEEVSSKVLGMHWDVSKDEFRISINVQHGELTKRKMLSTISSMYDPLGLVSPVAIQGKMLFQEATKAQLDWDDVVPANIRSKWNHWIQSLQGLEHLCFPRCITSSCTGESYLLSNTIGVTKPTEEDRKVTYELHSFSDASEKGYGCCCYLKTITNAGTKQAGEAGDGTLQGEVNVQLVASKSRVAPVSKISIPRLELQAALLSAQVQSMILEELELPVTKSILWVDSMIVLAYIQSDEMRMKTFVANRVQQIRNLTTKEQWRYVPGLENPADMISRGADADEMHKKRWQQGPSWLQVGIQEDYSAHIKECTIPEDDVEVKKSSESKKSSASKSQSTLSTQKAYEASYEVEEHPVDTILRYYSNWYRAKKGLAWLIKFQRMFRERRQVGVSISNGKFKTNLDEKLKVEDIQEAEKHIIRYVQYKYYSDEVSSLKSQGKVQKKSSIIDLTPMLDQDGLLSVEGRLKFLQENEEVGKNPWIIPSDGRLAVLLSEYYHNKAHQGTEWTLTLLRRKFWVIKARSIIKGIRRRCTVCKRLFERPRSQKMGDLPAERLQNVKPFTYVGIDCFGPFYIQQGRHQVKRYGCVFTCMTYRAIHVEKLNSLDTDSFINGFRRFMARRGTPSKVWSDNGTNFVGGSPDLIRSLQALDESKLYKFGLERDIQWYFNTPHASHMGGVWERQIRTIRRILTSLLNEHKDKVTDETIETLFCEVESMINSRPMTKVSEDPMDEEVITPNQILMLNEARYNPKYYEEFQRSDMYRRRWRAIQHIANKFWKRWVKEYIPLLQKRSKWTAEQENLKVGDVVLIYEENTPRYLWPMGLVVEVKEGRDGLVRSVKIKTKSTYLLRPVTKVVKIEG